MVDIYLVSVVLALEELVYGLGLALLHVQLYKVRLDERNHILQWHAVAVLVLLDDGRKWREFRILEFHKLPVFL